MLRSTASNWERADSAPRPGREIALETKGLTRVTSGKVLVDDISVRVRRGEVLAVPILP